MTVTYTERKYLDKYRVIDTTKTFKAISKSVNGGLTYFKINSFEYKVIDNDFIKSIEE